MAYGLPFDSYEPHPEIPGAYHFTPNGGGNPILAAGPEAERMRALIDRSAPKQDARTASMDYADVGRAMGFAGAPAEMPPGAPPAATDATMAAASHALGGSPRPEPPPRPVEAPTVPDQPPAYALPPPGGAAGAPAAQQGPAFDPTKYMRVVHTKAGYVPTSEKVTTEGGIQDPGLKEATLNAFSEEAKAAAASKDLQQTALRDQLIQADTQNKLATAEADKAQANILQRHAALQTGADEFNRVMGQKQSELQKASGREVDQNRLFKGKPGATIMAALSAGLGAFGSSMTHGPNFALDIINKQIDRDVEVQRDEIARGVQAKQNDIARIRDKYNVDTDTASKLLAYDLSQHAQALARQQAAQLGGQQAQMKLAALDQEFAKANVARLQAIKDTIYGKATVAAEQKYRQGGDAVVLDPRLKATAEATKYGKEITGNQYGIENNGSAPPKAGGGGAGKLSARLGATEAINESAQQDLNVLKKADAGGWIAPGVGLAKTDARIALDSAAGALVAKVIAAKGETPSHEAVQAEMDRAANANPAVREAYRKYAEETLKTVHSAVERQRGGTAVNEAGAGEEAQGG